MALATIIGIESKATPYISHTNTPALNKINMNKEMSSAEPERHVFKTWGTKDIVVSAPAAEPIKSINVMDLQIEYEQ